MKIISFCLITLLFITTSVAQENNSNIELGVRTKKYIGFYWVNGISAEWNSSKLCSGSLHLGLNIASSSLGSALIGNAIPTLETELSVIKYFRSSKALQPITRINFGFGRAFYGAEFKELTSSGLLCSIETGLQYKIASHYSASLFGGINFLTGNGITGLSSIYPVYYGMCIKYTLPKRM